MKRKNIYIYIGIAVLLVFGFQQIYLKNSFLVNETREQPISLPTELSIGSWLWRSPDTMNATEVESLLTFAQGESIDTVYVDITNYVDYFEMLPSEERDRKLSQFDSATRTFIQSAKAKGIKVEALAGNVHWANDSHSYIPSLIVSYVSEFNAKHPDTSFSGIHFDIEFYNIDDFLDNQAEYTQAFFLLMEGVGNEVDKSNAKSGSELTLAFDTAFWLDGENPDVKKMSYKGASKYPIYHILDIAARHPTTYITLMSYRVKPDATTRAVIDELEYVKVNRKNVPIVVAQETADTEEKTITFFGKRRNELRKSIIYIKNDVQNFTAFKGVAIHSLESYQDLSE